MSTPTTPPAGWRMLVEGETIPSQGPWMIWRSTVGPWMLWDLSTDIFASPYLGRRWERNTGLVEVAIPEGPRDYSQYDEGGVV